MEKTRLEMLAEALEASPVNPFLRYGLAMELKNAGRDEQAWEQFEHLLTHHPDYWATYLHAGLLLAKMNRKDDARRVMSRGVEVTGQLNNQHAKSELEAALQDLDS
jgi:Flp pilus assembly protein TadD